ncbi:MAG: histidine phosphatase family protein [Deltaproteobacteria bacterium]|nr:histidine phosphatase family protein [Candidatus Zymogenaceae bacterium]
MRIVLVTHAEASEAAPRPLTDEGILSAERAAARIGGVMGESWRVKKAVSSPAVRCVQTALVILGTLSGEKLRRLDTDPRLMAAKDPMEPDQLFRALADYPCEGLLVVLHADLANAMPGGCRPGACSGGWFTERPVICILDWEPERPWKESRVIALEAPDGGSLLPPGHDGTVKTKLLLT